MHWCRAIAFMIAYVLWLWPGTSAIRPPNNHIHSHRDRPAEENTRQNNHKPATVILQRGSAGLQPLYDA